MKCPACQSENRDGAKFCNECGHKLTLPQEEPANDFVFDEKIAKVQRNLHEDLTEKIPSRKDRIEAEREQVTVMFCDLEGFTPLWSRRCSSNSARRTPDRDLCVLVGS